MRRFVLLVGALGITACGGGIEIHHDYSPEQDFSNYQTYRWAERTPTGDDDPRVYNDLVRARVQWAVDSIMRTKGFERIDAGRADFLMSWHGAISGKVSYNTVSSNYGYGWGGYYGRGWGTGSSHTYVNEWDEGTLILHVIDAEANELVWMVTAQAKVNERRESPEDQRDRDIDTVGRMLQSFPPGGANQ